MTYLKPLVHELPPEVSRASCTTGPANQSAGKIWIAGECYGGCGP